MFKLQKNQHKGQILKEARRKKNVSPVKMDKNYLGVSLDTTQAGSKWNEMLKVLKKNIYPNLEFRIG